MWLLTIWVSSLVKYIFRPVPDLCPIFLALHLGLWSTLIIVHGEEVVQLQFFTCRDPGVPALFTEKLSFLNLFWHPLLKIKCKGWFLDSQFYLTDGYSYTTHTLSWFLELCSELWNGKWESFNSAFLFPLRLLWLFWVLCISIYILELTYTFSLKKFSCWSFEETTLNL